MFELVVAAIAMLAMVGCFGAGLASQRLFHAHHRSRDSIESIRVVLTLLVTFAALVLGLLISGAKTRFDDNDAALRSLANDIIEFDQQLREYGSSLDPLRFDLIRYTKAAIANTWPGETPPTGDYPRDIHAAEPGSVESTELGDILSHIDLQLRNLAPDSGPQRALASSLRVRSLAVIQQRWDLIAKAASSLSWPFLAMLIFWLCVIFALLGFSSPTNLVVVTVTAVAALSIASSVYLIVDLDTPLTGVLHASSGPLRDALQHLTRPPSPAAAP